MEFDKPYIKDVAAKNARKVRSLERDLISIDEFILDVFEGTFYADEKTWIECLEQIPLSLRPIFLKYAHSRLDWCDFMPEPLKPLAIDVETAKQLRRPRWIAYLRVIEQICGDPESNPTNEPDRAG